MIDKQTRERILALIHKEVVPAIGCTEPMAVALCTARAVEQLGCKPEKIEALLSANILKNAMGVGIPGTGMTGLPIAIALGALIGKSAYQLEVLRDLTPDALEAGKQFIEEDRIDIRLKKGISEKLYIEMIVTAGEKQATAVVAKGHTNFVWVDDGRMDEATLQRILPAGDVSQAADGDDIALNLKLVYDYATTAPLDEIRFILETRDYNMKAAREALKGNYGHNLGKSIDRPLAKGILGDSI